MGQSDKTGTMLSGMANSYLQKQMLNSMVGSVRNVFKSSPQPGPAAPGGLTV